MGHYSRISLWVVIVLILCTANSVQAQWEEVTQSIVPSPAQHVGALRARGSVAWAGTTELVFSNDSGVTWQLSTTYPQFTSSIADIAIYDSLNVLVGTADMGLYLTTDAGQTWSQFEPDPSTPSINQVAFGGSDSILFALSYSTSTFYSSTDQGATWRQAQTTSTGATASLCFAIAADKTIYVLSYIGGAGWLNHSTDGGATWSSDGGSVDGDSNTLSADSCDAERLYLVNENTVARSSNIERDLSTRLELTTDGGGTWNAMTVHSLDYYSGAMATTSHVLYVGTVPNGGDGVHRSTDAGATWENIGGPTEEFDTRTIAAINNNMVLVLDADGNIWRTRNSGGHPLAESSTNTALVLPSHPAQFKQASCGVPLDTAIALALTGCGTPLGTLDSVWITGSDAFQVSDKRPVPRSIAIMDSVILSYLAVNGSDSAELHLRFDLGNGSLDTTIELEGQTESPLLSSPSLLHREAASAYTGQQDTLQLAVDFSSQINLDSLWPSLSQIEATYSWDSSIVRSISYSPPSGWGIMSLQAHGNSEDISISKISAVAANPLDLGTAIFEPNGSQLATSWVMLPRFALDIGSESLTLCVAENEDSHWSVKDLGAQSGVTDRIMGNTSIALFPNPSEGTVWISSTQDLGPAKIYIYDILGILQREIGTSIERSEPFELTLPEAAGVYTILVKAASGTYELCSTRKQ